MSRKAEHSKEASRLLTETLDRVAVELEGVPSEERFVELFHRYTNEPYTPLASATLAAAAIDRLLSMREEWQRG